VNLAQWVANCANCFSRVFPSVFSSVFQLFFNWFFSCFFVMVFENMGTNSIDREKPKGQIGQ